MDIIIRPAEKARLPRDAGIYTLTMLMRLSSHLNYEPPSLAEFEMRFDTFTAQLPWFVCEMDGEVVGYSYAHKFHERPAYGWAAECTVYVKNGMHRRGIGRRALRVPFGHAQAPGLHYSCRPDMRAQREQRSAARIFRVYKAERDKKRRLQIWQMERRSVVLRTARRLSGGASAPVSIDKVNKTEEFRALLKESAKMIKVSGVFKSRRHFGAEYKGENAVKRLIAVLALVLAGCLILSACNAVKVTPSPTVSNTARTSQTPIRDARL